MTDLPVPEVQRSRIALLERLRRWESELDGGDHQRSTLHAGMAAEAYRAFDSLLMVRLGLALDRAGSDGAVVLQRVANGRGLERLTLGQRVDLLRALDKRRCLLPTRRALGRRDLDALNRIVQRRNRLVHGDEMVAPSDLAPMLDDLIELCDSDTFAVPDSGAASGTP